MWPSIRKIEPTATLDLFCNLEHEWSNRVEPEKMASIRSLLESYLIHDNHMGIVNHGWVSKKELARAWSRAHIWFYPCTFKETFCLTALEAAASETLVVTNHLAALKDTVGDRGVIIEGDPTTDEWKSSALFRLKEVLHDHVSFEGYIQKNREWASALSWGSQAGQLVDMVEAHRLEYKNMYNWTHDLPSNSRAQFLDIIRRFNSVFSFHHSVRVLEIGTYAGISLIEMMRHIPNAMGVGIDAWEDYDEKGQIIPVASLEVMKSFYANVEREGLSERISGIRSRSTDQLLAYIRQKTFFHLIYIDGSHMMCDCYSDMVLAWEILEPTGFMIVDDYLLHKDDNVIESPYHAVNRFLDQMNGRYVLVHKGYRVALQKLS
jgi:predicted O-methyltransferase YrrM